MLPGDFLPPRYDGPFVAHEWLGAPGGSPSVRFEDGIPVAWNPLSGVDREVGQFWFQDSPPPPGVHYAWLGEPHGSVSVRLDGDGNETARNLVHDPGFEQALDGLAFTNGIASPTRTQSENLVHSGQWAMRTRGNGQSTALQYVYKNITGLTGGDWIAAAAYVYPTHGAAGQARLTVGFAGGGPRQYVHLTPYIDARGGWYRLSGSAQVPEGYTSAWLTVYVADWDSSALSDGSWHAHDDWQFATADSEDAALAQVEHYFDGSTESDRAHDLWYNSDGVPHEWVNGEGWVAVTDDGFTPVPDAFMHLPISLGFDGDTPDITPRVIGHPTDIRTLDTYAVVNGVSREVESVSFDAELTGDMPAQVVAAGGVSGRTGTIVWSTDEDVQSREVSPWHKPTGWPPSAGDRVQVYVTDGTTSYPRFTGRIDKTTGTVGGGYQSTIIDGRDQLNVAFTHEALLRHHVPYQEGWAYRSIGLNFWHILVSALRKARVFNVPAMTAEIGLSMPLQGSVWAEAGTVTTAHAHSGTGDHAYFHIAPWGYSSGGFRVAWLPRTSYTTSQPLQITMMVAPDHDGDARIDVFYGETRVRLRAFRDRRVTAYVGESSVVSLSPSAMSGTNIVTLLVKNGVWELRNDAGRSTTGQASIPGSAAMSNGEVVAEDGARIAGVQVSRPNTTAHEFAPTRFIPNMRFHPGFLASTMDMSPRIENRNIADLVDEITKATLTAAWWDETGILNLVSTERLWNAEPVQTVTSLDDITELSWEDSLLSVRSLVKVDWKNPSISKSRYRRKELFRGPGDSMEATDVFEVFATPDNDTEWFGVDLNPRRLNDSNWGVYNRKRGSFVGVYYMNDNDEELPTSTRTTTIETERIGTVSLKITHSAESLGTGVEANLGTSESATALRAALRGDNLPVIRGFGEGKWVDDVTESAITGPSSAPTLTHDLGYWGQEYFDGDTVARRIGDFIAQQVTTPKPTIRSMSVTYDPRRQLGDTIIIELGVLGVRLRAVIVGISESHQPGEHTQQLTVRIISATSTRDITYEELQAAWGSGNYDGLQAVWQNLTYTNFENDPLEGAPE